MTCKLSFNESFLFYCTDRLLSRPPAPPLPPPSTGAWGTVLRIESMGGQEKANQKRSSCKWCLF